MGRARGFCLSLRAGLALIQTKTSLRLSNPNETPSSWCFFPTIKKPRRYALERFPAGLNGGRNRIRTYVGRSPTVLQTVAFDHSATLPNKSIKNAAKLPQHQGTTSLNIFIITKKGASCHFFYRNRPFFAGKRKGRLTPFY